MNELEPFKPSIDWDSELVNSLLWIAGAWVIAAVSLLIVFVALSRYTQWGRQFTTITGAYFTGRDSLRVWLGLGALGADVPHFAGSTDDQCRITLLDQAVHLLQYRRGGTCSKVQYRQRT